MTPLAHHLIAILYADVKDYSRHMQHDEAATIRQLKVLRACLDSTIASHHGRVANTAGDSVVAEFASVKDAVNCAVAGQQAMAALSVEVPTSSRLQFRIGLHMADIVRDGGDILGDGVNLAARIETCAEPGGVALSSVVYESVRGQLPHRFEPMGEQRLKNIGEPVRIYKVAFDTARAPARPPLLSPRPLAAVIAGIGGVAVLLMQPWGNTQDAAVPLPGPVAVLPVPVDVLPNSVAVLPLENLSPNADDAYFAAGVHQEILSQLSKVDELSVIARTTMRQYENTTKTIPEIARELNVQTVMEGSIRYADGRVLVTTQLIDASTSTPLWGDDYDYEFDDIFAIEANIAMEVAKALRAEFTQEEEAAMMAAPTDSPDAYNLYLAAMADGERFVPDAFRAGVEKVDRALALDPEFAQAWLLKSQLHLYLQGFVPQGGAENRAVAEQAARRAVELVPDSVEARERLASVLVELGRWSEAESEWQNIPEEQRAHSVYYAWLRFLMGRIGDDIPEIVGDYLEKDPLELVISNFQVAILDATGDVEGSIAAYQRGVQLFEDWSAGVYGASWTYLSQGDVESFVGLHAEEFAPIVNELLPLLDAPETAPVALRALVDSGRYTSFRDRQWLVLGALALKQPDIAVELAEPLFRGLPTYIYVLWRPLFADARKRPAFKTLVTNTGHVAYWREYGWPEFCQPLGTDDFECH